MKGEPCGLVGALLGLIGTIFLLVLLPIFVLILAVDTIKTKTPR